jgi:prepilin-type N-terminal cleavage/methylation domain-containing protein
MKIQATKKGFTLIELLVVISIIALLVSILLPALNEARNTARRILCLSNLHNQGIAFAQYVGDNRSMMPPQFGNYCWHTYTLFREDLFNANATTNQGKINLLKGFGQGALINAGLLDDQKSMYYCPCLKITLGQWEDHHILEGNIHPQTGDWYIWPAGSSPAGTARGSSIWGGYHYFKNNLKTYEKLAPKSFVYDILHDLYNVPHKDRMGRAKGLSVLYGDGHTIFNTDQRMFDEDLWDPLRNPDGAPEKWFPILSYLGNNTPRPENLPTPGNWASFRNIENLEDGTRPLGTWQYAP